MPNIVRSNENDRETELLSEMSLIQSNFPMYDDAPPEVRDRVAMIDREIAMIREQRIVSSSGTLTDAQIREGINAMRGSQPLPTVARNLEDEARELQEGETRCNRCERVYNPSRDGSMSIDDGHGRVCNECSVLYSSCRDCGENTLRENMYSTYDSGMICGSCEENYRSCSDCGDRFSDEFESDYCPAHRTEEEEDEDEDSSVEPRYRHFSEDDDKFVGKPFGTLTLVSERKFGVELEVGFKQTERGIMCSRKIAQEIGIAHDGSISGFWGYELQFPPMAGKPAEDCIIDTCKIVSEHGGKVNSSTGFHVHIDVNDVDEMDADRMFHSIRNLWLFYIAYEDVLLSFLPPSRRGNRYCKGLKADYHFREIRDAVNMEQLEKIWYRVRTKEHLSQVKGEKKHETRYRGINMHTLFSARHLEIRYHSGTINPRKILEWVNLHTVIADKMIYSRSLNIDYLYAQCNSIDINQKTNEMFSYLGLSPKSETYFRTRQELFETSKPSKIEPKEKKIVSSMLMEEVEA